MKINNAAPFWKGALGCVAGLILHLIIGSLYQWSIINVYITSFYKISDPSITLEDNAIVFPLMQMAIGLAMKPGIMVAEKIGTFPTLIIFEILLPAVIFASSFLPNFPAFIVVYGILFGLLAGMTFMLPLIECNTYFPGRKMYVNGFILVGTGLGSAIFGQFSSAFINPQKLPANKGYYDGELAYIAERTPQCIRYLALIMICLGAIACVMIRPMIAYNAKKKQEAQKPASNGVNQITEQNIAVSLPVNNESTINNESVVVKPPQPPAVPANDCPSVLTAFKSGICWILSFCIICSSCGVFVINGNYKTYVKHHIDDDNYLTLIGAIASIGNGCTRFFWSLLFSVIGYRPVMSAIICLAITVLVVVKFTIDLRQLYCFMIFLTNSCMGALLVVAPTMSMQVFGTKVGSEIYSFYWCSFATANLIGYAYVSQLSSTIGFDNIFYICVGMAGLALLVMIFYDFKKDWSEVQEEVVAPPPEPQAIEMVNVTLQQKSDMDDQATNNVPGLETTQSNA